MHSHKKTRNRIKTSNFTNCRKRKITENKPVTKIAKRNKNNTKRSIFDSDTGTPKCMKFDAFVQPQNSPANYCEFQTNEENNVALQSPISDNVGDKHDQPLTHEIEFELHQQKTSQKNMKKFHKALKFQIYKCCVCHEAWPLKTKPKNSTNYICSRCAHDKSVPKKFSAENSMIPFPVPKQLQGLTQFEEMLIARAFPVVYVYTKPRGGQRAYKGHVLTLPQDVQQLANVLPRCPKDLPVLIFTVNGKDNRSSDFVVSRKKVEEALYCLTGKNINGQPNNPLYKNVKIDKQTLANLPKHGILSDVTKVERGENADENKHVGIATGPVDVEDDERVYNSETEMNSFVPTNIDTKKEKEIITEEFLDAPQSFNWNVGDESLSEFNCPFLASMASPTLFPEGKGDPTNSALFCDTSDHATQSFAAKLKHLIKF